MTRPRPIDAGTSFFVTVRAVNRSFRFVPKRQVRESIEYLFAAMLQEYRGRIAAHEFLFMSNHYHLVGTDLGECLPEFMRDFHSMLSRQLNSLRGISGANIEKDYNLVVVENAERMVEHCVYTLANPCKAHLVARCRHWKGTSSRQLKYGVPEEIGRPKCGVWSGERAHVGRKASQRSGRAKYALRTQMPEKATLVLERPDVMRHLSDEQLRAHILERLDESERAYIAERKRENIPLVGWDKVVGESFTALPANKEERFGAVPSASADNDADRAAAAHRRRCFLDAYAEALAKFVSGVRDVLFPKGTWLMRRRYNVNVAALAP